MSQYARFFNKASYQWQPNNDYNEVFLRCQEAYFNYRLKGVGHLFLNEVFDALGLSRTCAGQLVGWVANNEDGDGCVKFELSEDMMPKDNIRVDFNVDGVILDLVDWDSL